MTTLTTTISNEADWSLSLDEGGGGADPRRVHDDDATGAPGANTRVNYAESETEDEEVKMNCIAGARGMEDSDMFTDCEGVDIDDGDDDDDDNSEGSDSEPEADENLVERCVFPALSRCTRRLESTDEALRTFLNQTCSVQLARRRCELCDQPASQRRSLGSSEGHHPARPDVALAPRGGGECE